MKTTFADSHYRTFCLRIQPTIGAAIRLTQYPVNLTMSNGDIYLATSGYEFTGLELGTGSAPASFDLEGIAGLAGIGRDQIASGIFDGARCYLFAVDWRAPVVDYEPVCLSILGKATLSDDRYRVEEMALIDALGQSVGKTYTPQCPKKFGGQEYAGCKKALGPLTVSGTVTGVTSNGIFTDTALIQADDYWALGTVEFTSGDNVGLKPQEIKSFSAGLVTLFEPFYYPIQVGDTYTIIPGCRKRLAEDCRDKWDNVVNFGGFAHMPTSSTYAKRGGT